MPDRPSDSRVTDAGRRSQRLTGRVAVVTGAAHGIGQALATRLAADGALVAVVDIADGSDTVNGITRTRGVAHSFSADISNPDAIARLKEEVYETYGPVDVLVNNAGIYPRIAFSAVTLEDWRQVFRVNVEAVLLTCQAFVPGMRERGWGRIINIGSNATALQVPDNAHYIASKMAVVGLTRALATDVGDSGITANVIAPSLVRTPGTSYRDDDSFARLAASQSIPRTQTPDDVAGAVSFLASDDSAFMTGQVLFVDGGLVRSS